MRVASLNVWPDRPLISSIPQPFSGKAIRIVDVTGISARVYVMRCSCGNRFEHRAERAVVVCFRCGFEELMTSIKRRLVGDWR